MKVQKIFTGLLLIALGTGLSGCYTQFSGLDRLDNDYNDRQYNLSTQEVGGYYDWSAGESAYEGENYIVSQPEKPYLYQDEYFDNETLDKEVQLLQSGIQIQDTEIRDWYAENGLQNVYWEGYDEGFDEGYDYGYEDGYDQGSDESLMAFRNKSAGHVYTSADFGYDQAVFENYWGTRWAHQYRFNYALAHSQYALFGNIYPYNYNYWAFSRYRSPSFLSGFSSFGMGCTGFNVWALSSGPFFSVAGNYPCLPFGQFSLGGWGLDIYDYGLAYGPLFGFYGHRGGIWGFNNNYLIVNNYYQNRRYGRTRSELYRRNPRTSGLYSANDNGTRSRSGLRSRSSSATSRSGLSRAGINRSRSSSSARSGNTNIGRSSSSGRSSSGVNRARSSGSSGRSGVSRSGSSGSSGSSGVGRSRSGGSSSGSSGRSGGTSGSSSGKRGGGSLSSAGGPDGNSGYRPSTEARIARTNTLLRQKNSALTAGRSSVRSSSVNRGTSSLNSRISNLLQSKRSSQASSSVRSRVSSPVKRTSVFRAPSSSGSRVRTSSNNAASRVRSATRSANTSRSSTVRRSSSSSRSSSVRRSSSSSSGSSRSSSGRSRSGSSSSSKRGGK